jgi:hypothetical protein
VNSELANAPVAATTDTQLVSENGRAVIETAEQANAAHQRTCAYAKAAVAAWIAIGHWLNRAKEEAGHGNFGSVLDQLVFSQEQASIYMRLAANSAKLVTVTNLQELGQRQLLALCNRQPRKPRMTKPTPETAAPDAPKTIEVAAEVVNPTPEPTAPEVLTLTGEKPATNFGEHFQQTRKTARFANRVSEVESEVFQKFVELIDGYPANEEKEVLQAIYNLVTRRIQQITAQTAPEVAQIAPTTEPVSSESVAPKVAPAVNVERSSESPARAVELVPTPSQEQKSYIPYMLDKTATQCLESGCSDSVVRTHRNIDYTIEVVRDRVVSPEGKSNAWFRIASIGDWFANGKLEGSNVLFRSVCEKAMQNIDDKTMAQLLMFEDETRSCKPIEEKNKRVMYNRAMEGANSRAGCVQHRKEMQNVQ